MTGAGHAGAWHRLDHRVAPSLGFAGGLTVLPVCANDTSLGDELRVYGSEGVITVTDPFLPGRGRFGGLRPRSAAGERVWPPPPDVPDLYAAEAEGVARHLRDDESPTMRLADSLGSMGVLDARRGAVGVTSPGDGATTGTGTAEPAGWRRDGP